MSGLVTPFQYKKYTIGLTIILVVTALLTGTAQSTYFPPQKGEWQRQTPESQGLNAAAIKEAVAYAEANESYGYMWWLNKGDRSLGVPGLSDQIFCASGFGGNFILVDQEHDLVVVTRWLEPSKLADFMKLLGAALE